METHALMLKLCWQLIIILSKIFAKSCISFSNKTWQPNIQQNASLCNYSFRNFSLQSLKVDWKVTGSDTNLQSWSSKKLWFLNTTQHSFILGFFLVLWRILNFILLLNIYICSSRERETRHLAQLAFCVEDVFPDMSSLLYPAPAPWVHPAGQKGELTSIQYPYGGVELTGDECQSRWWAYCRQGQEQYERGDWGVIAWMSAARV